jgi:hypothetical protein
MRALFLLLLAANIALLAWTRLGDTAEGASDPEPARRELQPDKIRILPGSDAPAPAKPAPLAAPAVPGGAPAACIEWGGFAVSETARAEAALQPLALGPRLSQRRSEETAGWWVFIPPQGNRPAAMKKTAELKGLGIEEYFVVQDEGPMRWAVSLGVFSSEDAAKSRLEALKTRGVRTAQVGERDTHVAKVWFQVRGADAPVAAKLRELAAANPGTDVKDCL